MIHNTKIKKKGKRRKKIQPIRKFPNFAELITNL